MKRFEVKLLLWTLPSADETRGIICTAGRCDLFSNYSSEDLEFILIALLLRSTTPRGGIFYSNVQRRHIETLGWESLLLDGMVCGLLGKHILPHLLAHYSTRSSPTLRSHSSSTPDLRGYLKLHIPVHKESKDISMIGNAVETNVPFLAR